MGAIALRDFAAGSLATTMPVFAPVPPDVSHDELLILFEQAIHVFQKKMLGLRTKGIELDFSVRNLLEKAAQEGPSAVDEARHLLRNIIQMVSDACDDWERNIEDGIEDEWKVALAARQSIDGGRRARKMQRKLRRSAAETHEWFVGHYYRLLALDAEFDPESRGGEKFDNADDLIASLG